MSKRIIIVADESEHKLAEFLGWPSEEIIDADRIIPDLEGRIYKELIITFTANELLANTDDMIRIVSDYVKMGTRISLRSVVQYVDPDQVTSAAPVDEWWEKERCPQEFAREAAQTFDDYRMEWELNEVAVPPLSCRAEPCRARNPQDPTLTCSKPQDHVLSAFSHGRRHSYAGNYWD